MSDDEVTHDADQAWLAAIRDDARRDAPVLAVDDAEHTTDADSDVVDQVRRAVAEARAGLAAPPTEGTAPDSPDTHRSRSGSGRPDDQIRTENVGGPAQALPPPQPLVAPPPRTDGRWQPPPRLRPADVPATPALLPETTARRRHLDWRWALAGVVAAAAIGFGVAVAVSGDDAPPPSTDITTTVATPGTTAP